VDSLDFLYFQIAVISTTVFRNKTESKRSIFIENTPSIKRILGIFGWKRNQWQ